MSSNHEDTTRDLIVAKLREEIRYREEAAEKYEADGDKATAAYFRNYRAGVIFALHIVEDES